MQFKIMFTLSWVVSTLPLQRAECSCEIQIELRQVYQNMTVALKQNRRLGQNGKCSKMYCEQYSIFKDMLLIMLKELRLKKWKDKWIHVSYSACSVGVNASCKWVVFFGAVRFLTLPSPWRPLIGQIGPPRHPECSRRPSYITQTG